MRRNGKVERIDTDHVLITWDDGTTSLTDLSDDNKKPFKVGDEVSFINGSNWDWNFPKILINISKK